MRQGTRMGQAPRGYADAIVHPERASRTLDVQRSAPSPALAGFVDYHWYVGWRLERPFEQQVVPQPRVHVAAEDGRLLVHGLSRQPFVQRLSGDGHVLGSAFLPGGFRPLLGSSVGALAGRVVPAGELFGADDRPTAAVVLGTTDLAEMVRAMEEYLLALQPAPDPTAEEVRRLVELVERDRGISRVETLARRTGVGVRTLQRLFTEYVGIGPKWVIQRYRILDAAAVAHRGGPVDWATLAAELGFSDQAHLTRTFTAVVGTPPATYHRES
jgi:AraC-like DNA-binding protein